ncbi:MAG: hypothetical protein ACOCVF_03295 [bacterium]
MAVKKTKLGKVLKNVKGYRIRPIGTTKSLTRGNGTSKTIFQPNGTLGVYAGNKKLVKDGFKTLDEAVSFAEKL